jgi:two-component system, NarL family, nitrate/nitrite response regulator NarL
MTGAMIRVTVGDDQPLFRRAVIAALTEEPGVDVVSESAAGVEALAEIRKHRPDVALLDARRGTGDAITAMGVVLQDRVPTRVAILSDSLTGASVYAALAAGVSACLSKRAEADEVRSAVEAVSRGEVVISPALLKMLVEGIPAQAARGSGSLSGRERTILELVALGLTSRQIGERLSLAPSTVKTYMRRVYEKLGVHGHTAAVAEALRRGVIGEVETTAPESSPATWQSMNLR